MLDSKMPEPLEMSEAMLRHQPILDYTTPELVSATELHVGAASGQQSPLREKLIRSRCRLH